MTDERRRNCPKCGRYMELGQDTCTNCRDQHDQELAKQVPLWPESERRVLWDLLFINDPYSPQLLAEAEQISDMCSDFESWKGTIVEDDAILGGEPVFPRSRLSVRHIGGLILRGAIDEVREDYPYLNDRDIEFAPVYAKAYPRTEYPSWLPDFFSTKTSLQLFINDPYPPQLLAESEQKLRPSDTILSKHHPRAQTLMLLDDPYTETRPIKREQLERWFKTPMGLQFSEPACHSRINAETQEASAKDPEDT